MRILLALSLAIPSALAAQAPSLSADVQIRLAVQAAPAPLRDSATIQGYDAAGSLVTLRRGTNRLICVAPDPRRTQLEVSCHHVDLEPFLARGRALAAAGVTGEARLRTRWDEIAAGSLAMPHGAANHILTGSGFDSSTAEIRDPFLRWVVYLPGATAANTGLPEQPTGPGQPWLMFPGTPGAHIMFTPPRSALIPRPEGQARRLRFAPIMGTIEPIMGTAGTPDRVARLLFGSVRRDVLSLLVGRPDQKLYFREILRAVGGGSGAVQRELKQLVDAGLVQREARGRQVFFSINHDSLIYPELRAIVEKTAGAPDVLRESLAPFLADERIAVALIYGSVASGEQISGSDVDLLVIGDATMSALVPALREAEHRLGREVNVSLFPPKEFRQKLKRGGTFLKRVLASPRVFVAGDQGELERLAR